VEVATAKQERPAFLFHDEIIDARPDMALGPFDGRLRHSRHDDDDEAAVAKMRTLLARGEALNPNAAARIVAKVEQGQNSAKADRLRKKFTKRHRDWKRAKDGWPQDA
jgi:hypothetical protein